MTANPDTLLLEPNGWMPNNPHLPVLPAGTGDCRSVADADFLVVGAHPPGQHPDNRRASPTPAMVAQIRTLPFPADPMTGDH